LSKRKRGKWCLLIPELEGLLTTTGLIKGNDVALFQIGRTRNEQAEKGNDITFFRLERVPTGDGAEQPEKGKSLRLVPGLEGPLSVTGLSKRKKGNGCALFQDWKDPYR